MAKPEHQPGRMEITGDPDNGGVDVRRRLTLTPPEPGVFAYRSHIAGVLALARVYVAMVYVEDWHHARRSIFGGEVVQQPD